VCKKRLAELREGDLFTQPDESHLGEAAQMVAKLRDKDLFEQPDESNLGECPICCLPLSLDPEKSTMMACCSKFLCDGCCHANQKREMEAGLEQKCPYCRGPLVRSNEEGDKLCMKRAKKNNCPVAMCHLGQRHRLEGNYQTALGYLTKAAELDDVEAHYQLSIMYRNGRGVEVDTKRAIYHAEKAAIEGHPMARHNLGIEEVMNRRFERARKHFIIAANLGYEDSLDDIKKLYAIGHASKEDYAAALRAYQAAVDATKSPERDEVVRYHEALRSLRA
jgi:tetratricopeptide (TPR) repeat protein